MNPRRIAAALAMVAGLSACGGGTSPEPESTPEPPAQEQSQLPTRVLQDAQDVADAVEQRQADLESMLP